MALSNVSILDTFYTHVIRTNQLVYRMAEVEGNVSNSINSALTAIPSAFAAANASFATSNSAFASANSAVLSVGVAYDKANSVSSTANTANSAAAAATATATAAFSTANTANVTASAVSITAASAFNKANTANTVASSAFATANSAESGASSAFNKANTANTVASGAFGVANTASSTASSASSAAATASTIAIAAFASANTKAASSHTHVKSEVGLGNVDNTSDASKPVSTATQTALNAKQDALGYTPVNRAGGIMTGVLETVALKLNSAAGTYREIEWRSGGIPRFLLSMDASAESGANAGSNLTIYRYTDAGGYLDSPFSISRATGVVNFGEAWPTVNGQQFVRTVNGSGPDGSGNVTVSSGVQDVRLGANTALTISSFVAPNASAGHVITGAPYAYFDGADNVFINGKQRPVQKQVSGTWTTVSQL